MLDSIDVEKINTIAKEAGDEIMRIYRSGDFEVEAKSDDSPLTKADKAANDIICTSLQELYPDIPIMSEENKQEAYEDRKDRAYYWCIDPLDGTKEFIKQNGEFTVNIALIEGTVPVLGVVYAPALERLYFAKKAEGAYREAFSVQRSAFSREVLPLTQNDDYTKEVRVVASKSHRSAQTESFIENIAHNTSHIVLTSIGSSLKLCMIAEGSADIYPRLAPTMEWDSAAAHAVVKEAGREAYIYDESIPAHKYLQRSGDLAPLRYNKPDLLNPFFVVV